MVKDPESGAPLVEGEEDAMMVPEEMPVPPASNHSSKNSNGRTGEKMRKLSTFSKMYDVDGDGELDEAELAMMRMDTTQRGFLTNDKVYKLMERHLELQRELFRRRRIILVLLALVAILALSNLGTSLAAATLSKDTTNSENAEVLDRNTKEQLSTRSGTSNYQLSTIESDGAGDGSGVSRSLVMDSESCEHMFEQCRRGNSVTLVRPFPEAGQESLVRLCPFAHGTLSRYDRSLMRTVDDESVTIEHAGEGHCTISGPAVTSREGVVCQGSFDCDEGYECRRSEGLIGECKRRCAMRRWAQALVEECQGDCDHTTCQAVESEGSG